jgi:hypothetical protein
VFSSELVATILSDDAFEVVHGKVIRIIPARSFEGNRKTGVEHFVVTLIEKGGGEERTITVWDFSGAEGGN